MRSFGASGFFRLDTPLCLCREKKNRRAGKEKLMRSLAVNKIAPTTNEEFDRFWAIYPHRKAKLDAQKAYQQARKLASPEEILAGVERYLRSKPDWQAWAFPASWLRAGRWMDEHEVPAVGRPYVDWWAECQELHGGTCQKRWDHETKKLDARMAQG